MTRAPLKAYTVNATPKRPTVIEARRDLAAYLERRGLEAVILSHRRFRDGWSFLVEIEAPS